MIRVQLSPCKRLTIYFLVFFTLQTSQINEFGFSWAVDKQECEKDLVDIMNPCDADTALAMDIETTCSLFDPSRNGGDTCCDGYPPISALNKMLYVLIREYINAIYVMK